MQADFKKVGELGYALYTGGYENLFKEPNERCDEMIFSAQMVAKSGNGNCFSFLLYPPGSPRESL